MYVSGAHRGAGLAQSLIDAAEGYAREHGAAAMKLWTDTRFERAHRFYEKHGYVRQPGLRELHDLSNSPMYHTSRRFRRAGKGRSMRYLAFLAALLCLGAAQAAEPYKVGMAQREFVPAGPYDWRQDPKHGLATLVWYPADAAAQEQPWPIGPP